VKIRDILRRKGSDVVTVSPGQSVLQAMQVLVEHNIGSVVVLKDAEIRGILTERDTLRLGAEGPEKLSTTSVGDVMTHDIVVGVADDDLDYAMNVMTTQRIRHLPIVDGSRLEGIVSIGDLVNALRSQAEFENRYLRDYIRGTTR
jgi:CBS domain-containing protein